MRQKTRKATKLLVGVLLLTVVFMFAACGEQPEPTAAPVEPAEVEEEEVVEGAPTAASPLTIRLGYEDNDTWPDGAAVGPDPEHAMGLVFKSIVEQRTGGAIKVELFPGSVLGSSREMTELTRDGVLEANIATGPVATFFPPFNLIYIPYLFQSEDIAWYFFDTHPFWQDLMQQMKEEVNLVNLGMGQNGVRNFTNNVRPIQTPADIEGLKFRVMENPIYVRMVESLGGEAIPIAWAELYTSLDTGVVDGQENPVKIIELGSIYEVQDYLTLDGHVWSEDVLLMNADIFDSLPVSMQRIIRGAGRQAALAGRAAETLGTYVTSMEVIQQNMEVYSPTAADVRLFQEAAQPAVIEWLEGEIGSELVNDMMQAVAEVEEDLGYR